MPPHFFSIFGLLKVSDGHFMSRTESDRTRSVLDFSASNIANRVCRVNLGLFRVLRKKVSKNASRLIFDFWFQGFRWSFFVQNGK